MNFSGKAWIKNNSLTKLVNFSFDKNYIKTVVDLAVARKSWCCQVALLVWPLVSREFLEESSYKVFGEIREKWF